MARPTTKQQLLEQSEDNFNKLFFLINSMTIEEQEKSFSFEDRDKNIRDVLAHLYEWHQLLLKWINSNQSGKKLNFLPEPYNLKTYPQLNIEFWEKHQATSYQESILFLQASHAEVMQLIETFTTEELFTKGLFSWTGTTSLGSYCVSATSSHYDWAMKKIKKHKKDLTGE
ncbi:ClbS/DfsB family four-helix bundle protein [uncultured Proteiniphilum sp.]|uniref:ClbS/DfsB family four-helix bundle protein n=1 Tax=uncultured Proteiniphilum sp. TaxID=497637 RepID=UPI002608833E|nr:ClbS/DfsB family four-helix bundle protein [uncultured Proteiniphilum sp.]